MRNVNLGYAVDCRALSCLTRGVPGLSRSFSFVVERESWVCVGIVVFFLVRREMSILGRVSALPRSFLV
jgi:hypothetical protein